MNPRDLAKLMNYLGQLREREREGERDRCRDRQRGRQTGRD